MFRSIITILFTGFVAIPCYAEFRDPTQPAYPLPGVVSADVADSYNELVLSAIWISSHSRRATINGVSGKQGQTITIEQASPVSPEPATPANAPALSNNSSNSSSGAGSTMDPGLLDKLTAIAPMQFAPLLATAAKSIDLPQLQEQNAISPPPPRQQANSAQHSKAAHIPARSSTIKIISIRKNSVIVEQDGERKTLQLVQRPYKTQ